MLSLECEGHLVAEQIQSLCPETYAQEVKVMTIDDAGAVVATAAAVVVTPAPAPPPPTPRMLLKTSAAAWFWEVATAAALALVHEACTSAGALQGEPSL
jgi:hypothetical protein